jgi:tRNA (cmo5U34)-methyltransferase
VEAGRLQGGVDVARDGNKWTEGDSEQFLDLSRFVVPERAAQFAAFCELVPGEVPGCQIVDLCCGEGILAACLLERFSAASVHGYDGSEVMLAHASQALHRFGGRFHPHPFDLAAQDWRRFPFPVQAFVSSLAIHHLEGAEKRQLFVDLAAALAPGGALVLADIILPAGSRARHLAAHAWDDAVRAQALEIAHDLGPLEIFRRDRWNYFADPNPDPMDRPSTLLAQLQWLLEAGFVDVDVYWLKAGHALFGGRKPD